VRIEKVPPALGLIVAEFGFEAALSGDGQTAADSNYVEGRGNVGVDVFSQQDGTWTTVPTQIPGTGTSSYFGWALALSGDGQALLLGRRRPR
jgi:hypothetical protein